MFPLRERERQALLNQELALETERTKTLTLQCQVEALEQSVRQQPSRKERQNVQGSTSQGVRIPLRSSLSSRGSSPNSSPPQKLYDGTTR